jgi:hypothetical protein
MWTNLSVESSEMLQILSIVALLVEDILGALIKLGDLLWTSLGELLPRTERGYSKAGSCPGLPIRTLRRR